jgi:hypothetical protein
LELLELSSFCCSSSCGVRLEPYRVPTSPGTVLGIFLENRDYYYAILFKIYLLLELFENSAGVVD